MREALYAFYQPCHAAMLDTSATSFAVDRLTRRPTGALRTSANRFKAPMFSSRHR